MGAKMLLIKTDTHSAADENRYATRSTCRHSWPCVSTPTSRRNIPRSAKLENPQRSPSSHLCANSLRPPMRWSRLTGYGCQNALDQDGYSLHSPSPSTLMPVLSIKRCSGPCDPRNGILTFKVFCRRLSVLKFGTAQSRPIRRSRLLTNPIVCLSADPDLPARNRHLGQKEGRKPGRPCPLQP